MEFGEKTISGITFGSYTVSEVWFGGYQVYPEGASYTYTLSNLAVTYSDGGSYLAPNQSNYAYLTGTYSTFMNGTLINQETVTCTPALVEVGDITILDGNNIIWNLDSYGYSEVAQQTINYRGIYNGITSSTYIGVVAGANAKSIYSSTIDSFSIAEFTSAFTIDNTEHSLDLAASATRTYMWTSGLIDETPETVECYVAKGDIYSSLGDVRGQGEYVEAWGTLENWLVSEYEEVTNNVTVYLTVIAEWIDPETGIAQRSTDTASATYTVSQGEILETDELYAEAPNVPSDVSYTITSAFTFTVEGSPIEYNIGDEAVFHNAYGASNFAITKNQSWVTISGLTATIAENISLQDRYAWIQVADAEYGEASTYINFTQGNY